MATDDPFDVFGGDSDAEDGGETDEAEVASARLLVEQANARLGSRGTASSHSSDNGTADASCGGNDSSPNNTEPPPPLPQSLPPQWPNRPPLYLGPMITTSQDRMGGGRGYVATRNLDPGTLLLVERPVFTWPTEQLGKELGLVSILHIIRAHDDASGIVQDMELLHPTMVDVDAYLHANDNNNKNGNGTTCTTEQVDKMMAEMRNQHDNSDDQSLLQKILDLSAERNIKRSDGKTIQPTDVYRMLLALRYNGFGTGLYHHFAIINHDENPNCIKFAPEDDGSDGTTTTGATAAAATSVSSCSEIRTTRFVKRGEALTISYMDPREVSHATRRQHLWDQHRFDIGDDIADLRIRQFELVGGEIPESSRERRYDDTTHRIESVLSELEEQMDEIKDVFSTGNFLSDQVDRAKAIEVASQELVTASKQQLDNANHLLVVRYYRLHLDASEALLKADAAAGLSSSQRNGVMCRFVDTARKLLKLQIQYLGEHHVDVGRTYFDLAQGINALLSHAPKQLIGLNLDGMKNFAQCSMEEDRCRREYERIHALYSRDTTEIVGRTQVNA